MKRNSIWLTLAFYVLAGCAGSHQEHHDHEHDHAPEHQATEVHKHDHHGHNHATHDHNHNHVHHVAEGHAHEHEVSKIQPEHDHSGEITLSRAEAEAIGLTTKTITPEKFHSAIPCSGVLQAAQGDEVTIVSPCAGVVRWTNNAVTDGRLVAKGSVLLQVSADRMASGDPARRARIDYETAKRAYDRAKELVKEQIISQQEYEQAYQAYETARLAYEAIGEGDSGCAVKATFGGYLKNILVKEGDFVEMGQPLMTLSQNRRLQLRVDVPQRYYKALSTVTSANFKTAYDDQVYNLSQLNGRLLSYGKGTQAGGAYIPVTFELDNRGDMIPGSYVEAYLISSPIEEAIVVPVSALTEEQGLYFVYLHLHDEAYKKQEVSLGETDGENVRILSGLHAGDKVVTRGVYQVKLAANSGVIPEGHSHNH